MLPWTRPEAHAEFAAQANKLLAEARADINAGIAIGKALEGREIWGGSWKRGRQLKGLHKRKLAEPDAWLAKCVWCEQLRELGRDVDVEHYRPKAEVCEWQGDPPSVTDTPPTQISVGGGYWWLAFTWDNYSLACKTCNQHWKRNLFPVRAPRRPCVEGIEQQEQPLLLDPASNFRTRDHFSWDVFSGIVEGVSDEGRATIIVCGLNREGLRRRRAKAARDTRAAADQLLRTWRMGAKQRAAQLLKRTAELTDEFEEFTSMRRWIVEQELGLTWEEFERCASKHAAVPRKG